MRACFTNPRGIVVALCCLVAGASGVSAVTPDPVASLKSRPDHPERQASSDTAPARRDDGNTANPADPERVASILKNGGALPRERGRRSSTLDDYRAAEIEFDWIDISEIGTPHPLGDDEQVNLLLPFDFPFYEVPRNSITISSNGYLSFGGSPSSAIENTPLPDPTLPNNLVAVFWDDLDPNSGANGQIYSYHDANNNRFIVQFEAVEHFPSGDPETFQCILQADGLILLQYESVSNPTNCTVGVENQNGTVGTEVCYNSSGQCPTSGLALLLGEPDGVPNPVTNLAAQVMVDIVVLTWIDPTEDTNGNLLTPDAIEIWRGQPAHGTLLDSLEPGVQTFTDEDVPDGIHLYTVRPVADGFFGAPRSVSAEVGEPAFTDDLESGAGDSWMAAGGWELGTPSGAAAPLPHSGDNVWGTLLSSDYSANACWQLDLNLGGIVSSEAATVEFWGAWDCESNLAPWDGCNLKISLDEGLTWEVVEPTGGYTRPVINPSGNCISGQPAWTGDDHPWEHIVVPIGQYEEEIPIFRWEFGSDNIISGAGFFVDDVTVWGMSAPETASVGGTIVLDGGVGEITDVTVFADGLGWPTTQPDASGAYLLLEVLTGERLIHAMLADYDSAWVAIDLPPEGAAGVDLILVRSAPPRPTGLTGTVANASGVASLNWDDSPDPLVDHYVIYLRSHDAGEWTAVGTSAISETQYTLTAVGIWDFAVSAVDSDASSPIESELSDPITLLLGSLPPAHLTADGNFDDRIELSWSPPGIEPVLEIGYDDGSAEAWLTPTMVNGPEDREAVRFTLPALAELPYPLELLGCAVHLEHDGAIRELTVYPAGADSFPDLANPLVEWSEVAAEGSPGWLIAEVEGAVLLAEPHDLWVVMHLHPDVQGPGIGGDDSDPDFRSFLRIWDSWWIPWNLHDYIMRLFVRSGAAGGTPGEIVAMDARGRLESAIPNVRMRSRDRGSRPSAKSTEGEDAWMKGADATPVKIGGSSTVQTLSWREPERRHTLDDIVSYVVYRDGWDIAHPTETSYVDVGLTEDTDHEYHVSAYYDDGSESEPTDPVIAACNMAPAPPTDLIGEPVGYTIMRLTWLPPTTNADGTALVDLAGFCVHRNGQEIAEVGAGVTSYDDTPPENNQFYTWTIRAIDEVPNPSAASEPFRGAVVRPWQEVEHDWVDISQTGTPLNMGDDDNQGPFALGFEFDYLGETYDEIRICSNGWLSFTSSATTLFNMPIPNPDEPNAAIYLFWDDLNPLNSGDVWYEVDEAAERFVASWIDVAHFSIPGTWTMQAILESSGEIRLNYLIVSNNVSCTVGIEDGTGSEAIQVGYNGEGWLPTNATSISFFGGPSGEIFGRVTEFGTGVPVDSALISVEGLPDLVYTGTDGTYVYPVHPGTYTVSVHRQGYCDQRFDGIEVADDASVELNAALRQPNATFSVTSLNLLTRFGEDVSDEFEISNPAAGCALEYRITVDAEWLAVDPDSGRIESNGIDLIRVTAHVGDMAPAEYLGQLRIQHNDEDSPTVIPIVLFIAEDATAPSGLPSRFALLQNYPNPFNATTSIRFELPIESHVRLAVFDVTGRRVSEAVNGRLAAGRHELVLEAEQWAAGVYVMRLDAGPFRDMRKMILLK